MDPLQAHTFETALIGLSQQEGSTGNEDLIHTRVSCTNRRDVSTPLSERPFCCICRRVTSWIHGLSVSVMVYSYVKRASHALAVVQPRNIVAISGVGRFPKMQVLVGGDVSSGVHTVQVTPMPRELTSQFQKDSSILKPTQVEGCIFIVLQLTRSRLRL
jgi:hypothetical protein